jgi:hypothetical protein
LYDHRGTRDMEFFWNLGVASNDVIVLEDWLLSLMSTLVMGFGPQD